MSVDVSFRAVMAEERRQHRPDAAAVAPAIAQMIERLRAEALNSPDDPPYGVPVDEIDAMMSPWGNPERRRACFARLTVPEIRAGGFRELDADDTDAASLEDFWMATYGWGATVQGFLDDPTVTEIKINGTTVMAQGAHGLVVVPAAYVSVREPFSRAAYLTQSMGVTWNEVFPAVTVPLPGMRMHVTRSPWVRGPDPETPGLMVVMRRGRQVPWTVTDLVTREMLDTDAAELLVELVTPGVSVLCCGAQDSGKTTMLECLLNSIAPREHLIIIEDNTDEFTLQSPLVTRVRINDSHGDDTAQTRARVVRETLRMTPGRLVVGEIRGDEAGPVLQMAEGGRPVMTTMHAATIPAALTRFARLAASDLAGNSFARQRDVAELVLSRTFAVVILTRYAERIQRRIVDQVALLDGCDVQGQPQIIPVISSSSADDGTVTWTCHARVAGAGALVWNDGVTQTPATFARALRDIPDRLRRTPPLERGRDRRMLERGGDYADRTTVLQQARQAVADGRYGDAVPLLTQAEARGGADRQIMSLVDQIRREAPDLVHAAEETIAGDLTVLREALVRWELGAAQQQASRPDRSILIARIRSMDRAWQAVVAEVATCQERVAQARQAVDEAHHLHDTGAVRQAVDRLRDYVGMRLPETLVSEIRGLLQHWLTTLHEQAPTAEVAAQYVRERARLEGRADQPESMAARDGDGYHTWSAPRRAIGGKGGIAPAGVGGARHAAARDGADSGRLVKAMEPAVGTATVALAGRPEPEPGIAWMALGADDAALDDAAAPENDPAVTNAVAVVVVEAPAVPTATMDAHDAPVDKRAANAVPVGMAEGTEHPEQHGDAPRRRTYLDRALEEEW